MSQPAKVAIIGGGITGLSAAFEFSKHLAPSNITLFEKSTRFGGILKTEKIEQCLVETSADMFLSKPDAAIAICQELGLADQLIEPETENRRSWIGLNGKLHPIPEGFSIIAPARLDSILKSDLLSSYGKLRLMSEIAIPAKNLDLDVSLKDFAVSRFGQEAFDRLIQPLIAGIYTADPEKLSMQATMPQVFEKLKKHGSLIKAAKLDNSTQQRQASGARYGLFRSLKNGMHQLTSTLYEHLRKINLNANSTILKIAPQGNGWDIFVDQEQPGYQFDQVVVATPTYHAAAIVREFDETLSDELASIEYASAAIIVIAARRTNFEKPLEGFGLVIPSVEGRPAIAVSCSNRKFAGRAPNGIDVYRVFVGGALNAALVDLNDDDLARIGVDELKHWFGFNGQFEFVEIFRWPNAMPQYHVGHKQRVDSINRRTLMHRGLHLAGNAYNGVGIPACIAEGRKAAQNAIDQLTTIAT